MIRRKKIYRGFNKRRNNNAPKIVLVIVCVSIVGGYTFVKVKNSEIFSTGIFSKNIIKDEMFAGIGDAFGSMMDKITFWDKSKRVETMTNNDLTSELEAIQKEKGASDEAKIIEQSDEVKLAKINGWNVYTIQVASVDNENDRINVENTLSQNKIPFSTVEVDGVSKVQTYSFFDKETTRTHLDSVKAIFPDAFLATVEIPMLSFKYTDKYSYANSMSEGLNKLITNFEEESKFWTSNTENIDTKSYNEILTKRKEILKDIQEQVDKIDYKEMETFKSKLNTYIQNTDEKVDEASKAANEDKYNLSESLFLSSMHGYFSFIKSINEA